MPSYVVQQVHLQYFIFLMFNIDAIEFSQVKNLVVILDPKLTFYFHVAYVISKFLSMLEFIQRNSSELTDPSTILYLYNSLVHPHLEYYSVIWNSIYVSFCFKTEKVQKNLQGFFFQIRLANGEAMLSKQMCFVQFDYS